MISIANKILCVFVYEFERILDWRKRILEGKESTVRANWTEVDTTIGHVWVVLPTGRIDSWLR